MRAPSPRQRYKSSRKLKEGEEGTTPASRRRQITIAGRVIYGSQPIPAMKVTLATAEGKVVASSTTDDLGNYRLSKVHLGVYTVSYGGRGAQQNSKSGTAVND